MNSPASTASDPRRLTAHPENGRVAALPRLHPHCWRGIFFALLLPACGGDFHSAADPELAAGAAGAAGDVDPGTGGSAGTAGAEQGGSAGSGGGPAGAAGSGGSTAGSAGSGSSGSSGSGATGAGGEPSGGAAGSGPGVPTCSPEEAITLAALPESFTWDGFSAQFDDVDQSYCAHSDGGPCTLRNAVLTFWADSSVTLNVYLSCTASLESGVCGAETPCATTVDPNSQASPVFSIVPDGDGYRLGFTGGGGPRMLNEPACWVERPMGGYAPPADAARPDLTDDFLTLIARRYSCP